MFDLDMLLDDQTGIYLTEFPSPVGLKFYWKLLSLAEYKKFANIRNTGLFHPFFLYKKVFERCYLGNSQILNQSMPMFIPISIGQLIMYVSGDCNADTIGEEIELARQMYSSADLMEQMKLAISTAYPTYTPEQLEGFNRIQLINKFVEAEAYLIQRYPEAYKQLDTSKIVRGSDLQQEKPLLDIVDTETENAVIRNNLSPWDMADIAEEEYRQKRQPVPLTPDQLRKLDRARRN